MSDWRGTYLAISFFWRLILPGRLNLYINESGDQDLFEGLYLVAVVLHDILDSVLARNVTD